MKRVALSDCTKLQLRYLHKRVCWLCEMRLDQDHCGGIWGDLPGCTQEIKDERRARCLQEYKPRARKR